LAGLGVSRLVRKGGLVGQVGWQRAGAGLGNLTCGAGLWRLGLLVSSECIMYAAVTGGNERGL